jgi:hypothetical protein
MQRIVWILVVAGASAAVGCKHHSIGITLEDTDEGTRVDRAAVAAAPALRTAPDRTALLPARLVAARVESVHSGTTYRLEQAPEDQQSAFAKRVREGGLITDVMFINPDGRDRPVTLEALRQRAAEAGANLLLVYEHQTPITESGSLIYKAVFDSRAEGTLYNTRSSAAVCGAEGKCTGTLGGLTPLNLTVHAHVLPETKRQAIEKLADALRETLRQAAAGPAGGVATR